VLSEDASLGTLGYEGKIIAHRESDSKQKKPTTTEVSAVRFWLVWAAFGWSSSTKPAQWFGRVPEKATRHLYVYATNRELGVESRIGKRRGTSDKDLTLMEE
jgi:hypothetical protein